MVRRPLVPEAIGAEYLARPADRLVLDDDMAHSSVRSYEDTDLCPVQEENLVATAFGTHGPLGLRQPTTPPSRGARPQKGFPWRLGAARLPGRSPFGIAGRRFSGPGSPA